MGRLELYGPEAAAPSVVLQPRFNTMLVYDSQLCAALTRVESDEAPWLALVTVYPATSCSFVASMVPLTLLDSSASSWLDLRPWISAQ